MKVVRWISAVLASPKFSLLNPRRGGGAGLPPAARPSRPRMRAAGEHARDGHAPTIEAFADLVRNRPGWSLSMVPNTITKTISPTLDLTLGAIGIVQEIVETK